MIVYFKNTYKNVLMREEEKEHFRDNIICQFCKKGTFVDKIRDHSQLTGENRGPAHQKCNVLSKRNKYFYTISTSHIQ